MVKGGGESPSCVEFCRTDKCRSFKMVIEIFQIDEKYLIGCDHTGYVATVV